MGEAKRRQAAAETPRERFRPGVVTLHDSAKRQATYELDRDGNVYLLRYLRVNRVRDPRIVAVVQKAARAAELRERADAAGLVLPGQEGGGHG